MLDNSGLTDQVLRLINTGSQLIVVGNHRPIGHWLTYHKLVLKSSFDRIDQSQRNLVLHCARHGRFACVENEEEEEEDPYERVTEMYY